MTIKIYNNKPSMTQYVARSKETNKKAPIQVTRPAQSYTQTKTLPIRRTSQRVQSFAASVESEIRSQQAFSTYAQLIKKVRLNRFKTRFDLFL
ncbi:hypothetical protein EZV73_17820 [Acidaminobacter sp. JC074]|uniref:hypothetical protein n=1 Tax=Acidaminobacter sp. JC074 TaxID=2530199 RepID=UPI001F0F8FCB|nr:hypothetical protein [Acidaminobacter sp. JC074]MCH4889444.1 hypothetical protein [Acidaminobacter sp. JC074]